jgi:hypothetical protein
MKWSNIARRIEPFDASVDVQPPQPEKPEPCGGTRARAPRRPRFDQRTIEIRDQGFALFRMR